MMSFRLAPLAIAIPFIATAQIPLPPVPATPPASANAPVVAPDVATSDSAASTPELIPSVSFEVKVVRSGGASNLDQSGSNSTGVGIVGRATSTLDRTRISQVEIEIAARNFARHPGRATVEWFFFSTPVTGGNNIRLFSQGSQEVLFKPGALEKIRALSDAAVRTEMKRVDRNISTSGGVTTTTYSVVNDKSGDRVAGWLVRVIAGGKVLGIKASSPRFEVYGRDAEALTELPQGDTKAKRPLR